MRRSLESVSLAPIDIGNDREQAGIVKEIPHVNTDLWTVAAAPVTAG
jgi:hypothetical protein